MSALITLHNLAIGHRGRILLAGLSLAIHSREFWGIVGSNGSGKTTLLKTIVGILTPVEGVVERASALTMGYVPQRGALDDIFPLTALDVVLMGRYPRIGLLHRVAKADRALALS